MHVFMDEQEMEFTPAINLMYITKDENSLYRAPWTTPAAALCIKHKSDQNFNLVPLFKLTLKLTESRATLWETPTRS